MPRRGGASRARMTMLRMTVGTAVYTARMHPDRAPRTCEAMRRLLPVRGKLLQGRWSGESLWVPLGDLKVDLAYENHTSYPAPGEILFYCFGLSETEFLISYGPTVFSSRVGLLAGNHFATLEADRAALTALGRHVHYDGAQDVTLEMVD